MYSKAYSTEFNNSMLDKTRDKKAHRSLQEALTDARTALISEQQVDGHWVYQLEADCTIPAEYILMNHFVDEIDDGGSTASAIAQKLGVSEDALFRVMRTLAK